METTEHGWNIIDRNAGVAWRDYEFREDGASARTFTAKIASGKLLVISPSVNTPDGAFEELAKLGEVGAVMTNNGFHHLGLAEWRSRFPSARFFGPPLASARIRKKNPSAPTLAPLADLDHLLGEAVTVRDQPDTRCGESWCHVRIEGGYAWYTSDILANYAKAPGSGVIKLLMKLTGSAPGFRVSKLAMMAIVKDRKGLLRRLQDDLIAHPPTILAPAHGGVLSHKGLPKETQELVAAALS